MAKYGNGDKFVVTVGAVSMVNVVAWIIANDFLGKVFVNEFDCKKVNAVDYKRNGTAIWLLCRPFKLSAIHADDVPESFIREYARLKVVIGGDTFPNEWYIKYATNADLAIHETSLTPPELVKFYEQRIW